ncbi:polysaccharide lyase family 8 super-sandwich domain-containing protein [Mucilaginibacter sp. PAMB04168]|uniref:polysaccharide lyase family 8 super-sandwich domain-containing protein n=1 Tax=Mucilaginibacter sp. PAMB04168 TaxID=3138567 RepID=UPI0031F6F40C
MKTSYAILFTICLVPFAAFGQGVTGSDLDYVRSTTRRLLLSDTAYATEQSYRVTDDVKYTTDGPGYFKSLKEDGSWADLDYQSPMRSAWLPSWHLYRTMLMCRVYYKTHDAVYLKAVHLALKFWVKNDFQCSNWWQNNINTPFAFSSLMIMLDKDAIPEELAYLNQVLVKRMPVYRATGQNLIWQLDNQARAAMINHDEAGFARLIKEMQSIITVSLKEGIQPDFSFQQHGVMLQFGNYGLHFVNSLLFWMTVTAKTNFAFEPGKQKMLFDYCSNGLRWTVFKQRMDLTAIGRQLRTDCGLKRGEVLLNNFGLLRSFDTGDACKYAMDGFNYPGSANCTLKANRSFWTSDYMVHMQKDKYMMSVKMHGSFVKRIESINGENLRGPYLNDGVTLIQQTGNEYRNIEPLWNWQMLPGITTDTSITLTKAFATANNSPFVGQVSDSVAGISAMIYNRMDVKANKSYFFVDDMLIALGAGITSLHPTQTFTTVNQRFAGNSKVYLGKNKQGEAWLWHDNMVYIFPDNKQEPITDNAKRQGNWINIDKASADKTVKGEVFTTYLSHAKKNDYAYIIKPAVNLEQAKSISENTSVKVLVNTATVQAIQSGSRVMAVFYAPGSVTMDNKQVIKADKPCLVILNTGNGNVWVSDPTRTAATISLEIGKRTRQVQMPSGDYGGSTIKM